MMKGCLILGLFVTPRYPQLTPERACQKFYCSAIVNGITISSEAGFNLKLEDVLWAKGIAMIKGSSWRLQA